jgi:ring-1,2-phenylacetyl-CoA epoxidase subunit PaaC
MRREETYHLMHADAWLRRLTDGAPEGRERLARALRQLWPDAQEVFAPLHGEDELLRAAILGEPMHALHATWQAQVRPVLEPIAGPLDRLSPTPDGRHRRTDDFRWLHGELTAVARSQVGATW